jgi:hypothetical protein
MVAEAVAVYDQVAARVARLLACQERARVRLVSIGDAMRLVAAVAAGAGCAWQCNRVVAPVRWSGTLCMVARVRGRVLVRAHRFSGRVLRPGGGISVTILTLGGQPTLHVARPMSPDAYLEPVWWDRRDMVFPDDQAVPHHRLWSAWAELPGAVPVADPELDAVQEARYALGLETPAPESPDVH